MKSPRVRALRLAVAAAVCVEAVGFSPTPALAAEGDLDPGFGTGGTLTTSFPVGSYANAVAIQPDGKIVAVGAAAGPSLTGEFAVARYGTDGTLDAAFSEDGMLTTPIAGGGDEARSVAIQPNGRIVVAGIDSRRRFAVVRYLADGSLDPSFDDDGIVRTNITRGDDLAYDLAIQSDGKIVVVGSAGPGAPRFAIVRYRPGGGLDRTFGDHGMVVADRGWSTARSVVLQPDGRIVVAGYGGGIRLERFRPSGRRDRSFGGDGVVDGVGGMIFPLAVALQDDGRIVVAGAWDIFEVGLARFTTDGALDPTFGVGGLVHHAWSTGDEQAIDALVIQDDGRIVAVGSSGPHEFGDPGEWRFVLTRYETDGTLDTTWGTAGEVVTDFPGGGSVNGAAAQSDGNIVVVGGAGDPEQFALARYLVAGP